MRGFMPSLVTSLFLLAVACGPRHLPNTPLLRGVEHLDYEQSKATLERRLAPRFRVGMPEAGLASYLEEQGLHVERKDTALAPGLPILGHGEFRFAGPICPRIVSVWWRGDRAGIIREIDAQHSDTGCF